MRNVLITAAALVACGSTSYAQMGRTSDWWTYAGDAQRSGWEKTDQKFLKEDVKKFQKLWTMKLEEPGKGARRLAAPVILGNLIGSRGFKELAFVQGANGRLWSIDSDLARMYWDKQLSGPGGAKESTCGVYAPAPTLPAPVVFRFRPRQPATALTPAGAAGAAPGSNQAPTQAGAPPGQTNPAPPAAPSGLPGGQGIPGGGPSQPPSAATVGAPLPSPAALPAAFRVRPIYVLTPDGKLRQVNVDDGSELHPAAEFLPPGTMAQSLNATSDAIFAVTPQCADKASTAYALDISNPAQPKVTTFTSIAPIHSDAGPTLGSDGTLYLQTGNGQDDPTTGSHANAVLALKGKELKVSDYMCLPSSGNKEETGMNITAPVLFNFRGRELMVTAGKDGRLYLLDPKAPGGADHKTPLSKTEPLVKVSAKATDKGIWRNLASWETLDTTRYVLATVWGPLSDELKAAGNNGPVKNGAIVAFKLVDQNGEPRLDPVWTSRDMETPDPPVIAQGVVFAVANGRYKRKLKKVRGTLVESAEPANGTHATLYALDGLTGNEMWSTGDQVKAAGSLTGVSIANSRVYFTTVDNTVQVFGKYLETEQ